MQWIKYMLYAVDKVYVHVVRHYSSNAVYLKW